MSCSNDLRDEPDEPGIQRRAMTNTTFAVGGDIDERTGPSGESATGELIGWTPNGRPDHLRAACEASLRRLRLDRIDLY
jgi:aryl-alcohol dehydrogenase-like predicted oxidoreductase